MTAIILVSFYDYRWPKIDNWRLTKLRYRCIGGMSNDIIRHVCKRMALHNLTYFDNNYKVNTQELVHHTKVSKCVIFTSCVPTTNFYSPHFWTFTQL